MKTVYCAILVTFSIVSITGFREQKQQLQAQFYHMSPLFKYTDGNYPAKLSL